MHPSKRLYQLQVLDLDRDAKYRRSKVVIASLNEPEALRSAAAALSSAQAEVARARARRRNQELETKTLEAKIANTEERLYSGRVRNPKELTDLQNDSASLRRHRATLDDHLIEAMIDVEEAENAEVQARNTLDKLQAEWQTNQSALTEERGKLEQDIAALTEQRQKSMTDIEPDHLETYKQLRHKYAGLAVAPIEGGGCTTCGVEISDRVLAKTGLTDSLSFCTNCDRILLVE